MDPTSPEESTPWDPITGKLRTHTSVRRAPAQGLSSTLGRDLAGTTGNRFDQTFGDDGFNHTVARDSFGATMARPKTSGCALDVEHSLNDTNARPRTSDPKARSASLGTTKKHVSFSGTKPSATARSSSTAGSASRAARALLAQKAAETNADPPPPESTASSVRYDILNDNSGHNMDADGQTMMGIEVKERFNDMRTAFLGMDLNFDGKITKDELMIACRKWNIPLSEAQRVMNCADTDENGHIDFDEFAKRFDPFFTVSPDDEEILRLYQEGVMAGERPLRLTGVYHGTSTAEPLVDEAANLRSDNADLRGRLARCMRTVADLQGALQDANARNDQLEKALEHSQAQVASLTRTVRNLTDDLHRAKDNERAANERADDAERQLRAYRALDAEDLERRQRDQEDAERRRRDQERELERIRREELERLRRQRELESRPAMEIDCDDKNTVLVYGRDGCDKTQAMHSALKKAKIPFETRSFEKDRRFVDIMKKCGYVEGPVYAPVVCLGDKAWWYNPDESHVVPWPQEVACELRRLLGLNNVPLPVRVDADIDTEIYERFLSMQDAFLKLDVDKDGKITKKELKDRCVEWHIPTCEADRVIAEAGSASCDALDFDRFAKRFGGHRHWGSRGPLKGQAPAPHRHRSTSRAR